MTTFFLDTNIVMYAAGKPHHYKIPCMTIILMAGEGKIDLVTDTEVFQEIFYRYFFLGEILTAINLTENLLQVVREILPVTKKEVELMSRLYKKYKDMQPRDIIHIASMLNNGIPIIISADKDFDRVKEIKRIDPVEFLGELQAES